jgi:lipopolysaccharide/colanic/teichoic acid biosynthesis glycosyltransferase
VSGRSTTTYEKRIEYDVRYSQEWSMALDVKILIATIPALVFTDGAY